MRRGGSGGGFAHIAERARSWSAIVTRAILIVDINLEAKKLMKASLARPGIASRAAAPSPARHGGCKKIATAAPLPLSRNRAGEGSSERGGCHILQPAGEGSLEGGGCPILQPSGGGSSERCHAVIALSRNSAGEGSLEVGGCPILQPSGEGPSEGRHTETVMALCYENSSAFPPCFSGEIKANDGTLFSARVGWAEGPSRTPATERARDLQKEAVAISCSQRARDLRKDVKQMQLLPSPATLRAKGPQGNARPARDPWKATKQRHLTILSSQG